MQTLDGIEYGRWKNEMEARNGSRISIEGMILQFSYRPSKFTNHLTPFHLEFGKYFFQLSIREFWTVWVEKNKTDKLFAVQVLMP